MMTNLKSTKVYADLKVNVRLKLSALWMTLMLFYIYADILGFYTQGNIEKIASGEIGGVQITEGFLLGMAVWMALPSLLVVLSLALKASLNRWVNILAGIVSLLVLGATFFVGDFSARYTFQAAIEALLMVSIVWLAWSWPKQERDAA